MHSAAKPPYGLATEIMAWIARVLICGLLLVAPWPYAMADWSSQVWLVPVVGAVLLMASLVALSRRISVGNPLVWSLSLVLVVGLVQIIPLPDGLWQSLSPTAGFLQRVDELAEKFAVPDQAAEADAAVLPDDELESSESDFEGAVEQTLSISPFQTRTTLCVFAMALAMLISAIILFRDRLSVVVLLGTIALSGTVIALLGIYQAVAAGDWTFLGNMTTTSFATFYGRNSAPQFFACALGATAGLLVVYHAHQVKQQEKMADKRYRIIYPSVNIVARLRRRAEQFVTEADVLTALCLVAMAILLIAVMAANSRGGILAIMASGALVILVYAMGRQAGWSTALVTLLLMVGTALFLSMFGFDELIGARLDTLNEEAYRLDNVRLQVWSMAFSQPSCWVLGSGLGTFHLALLPSYETPQGVQFAHAENIYVELASNAGVITLLVALWGLGWLIWQLLVSYSNSHTAKATRLACLLAVLAVALQNMVDFSLMLPAIFLPLSALVGAYLGTRHHVRHKVRVRSSGQPERHERSRSHGTKSTSSRSHSSGLPSSKSSSSEHAPAYPAATSRRSASDRALAASGTSSADLPSDTSVAGSSAARPAEPAWAPATLVICILLVSCAVLVGYRPLAAYAFAEQLQDGLKPKDKPKSAKSDEEPSADAANQDLLNTIELASASQWSIYPESHLQIGRLRQMLASEQIQASDRWPAELDSLTRRAFSQPQFFNTAFHGSQDPMLVELEKILSEETAARENLADSQFDMRVALAACPMEWRASWGLMRADLGEMSSLERRRNYARILLTCRAQISDLQAAATHAMMVGEAQAGLAIWREILPVSYVARAYIFELSERFLTTEQLLSVLPESPLLQIEMAIAASARPNLTDTSQAIVESIDLDAAFERARFAADWPAVAWCAQRKGARKQEIKAWRQAQAGDPRNHTHAFHLAMALERDGQLQEALRSIEAALEVQSGGADYTTERDRLKALLQPTPAPPSP
jgi:tetratricopeptide (TPR) repeat protein